MKQFNSLPRFSRVIADHVHNTIKCSFRTDGFLKIRQVGTVGQQGLDSFYFRSAGSSADIDNFMATVLQKDICHFLTYNSGSPDD